MNRLTGAIVALALPFLIAAAAPGEPPLMTVVIKPGPMSEAAGKGDVDIAMTIPAVNAPAGATLLSMGLYTPGLARPHTMSGLTVTDDAGPVPMIEGKGQAEGEARDGPHQWSPSRPVKGQMTVRYRVVAENIPALVGGPPTSMRIDGDGVSGVGDTFFMRARIEGPRRVAIKWDLSGMAKGAQGVSSYGDGDVTLPAGPIDRIYPAVYMAGTIHRVDVGAFSAVWTGEPPFDPTPSMLWTAKLHKWMSGFFKDTEEPPYRVFARYNPMNAGGGAALTHSFIITYGKGVTGENFKGILGHEMTHTWTANDIAKWYDEGDAVYYQAQLPWRAGLFTTEQYLADLNETASRYYTNAMRSTPESEVLSHFWEDTRIRVLPYDRGAMYFAVLNGKVRKASGGKRTMDDLIFEMVRRAQAGEPLTEQVWLDLLRKEIGEEGPKIHASMLAGGLMLPESEDFGPCFRRVTKKIRQFDLGFDNASFTTPVKVIQGLKPGSEADKAGLRNGDVVTYAVSLDQVQGDIKRTLDLKVTRDGKTFPVSYPPRGDAVDAYQWERVPGVPDSACHA
jgi:predicted metalloprotease with PDZ domain